MADTPTNLSDVVSAGVRGVRKIEDTLQSGVSKVKSFVSDRIPESVKEIYRNERGYTLKSQPSRQQTRKR